MPINWEWFKENIKGIVIFLLGILLVSVIERWANGTNYFLNIIQPFIIYLTESLLIILIILLIGIYWNSRDYKKQLKLNILYVIIIFAHKSTTAHLPIEHIKIL